LVQLTQPLAELVDVDCVQVLAVDRRVVIEPVVGADGLFGAQPQEAAADQRDRRPPSAGA
jgi:hypothetical protein